MRFASLVLSACVLTACGGGGGGSGGGYVSTLLSGQVVSASTAFDSFFVSPNVNYSVAGFALPASGSPDTGPNASPSYFYDVATLLQQSPSAGTQRVTEAAPGDLTRTPLGLPTTQPTTTYFADGAFYKQGSPATNEISYSNGEVVATALSADGLHRLSSLSFVQVNVYSLKGTIVSAKDSAPGLLPERIYTNTSLTTPGAVWGSGAAYVKTTYRFSTDTYIVNDETPFRTNTTIQKLIDDKVLSDIPGTLILKNGAPLYVTNSPQVADGITSYPVLYQLNSNVYAGAVVKAGSVLTTSYGYNAQARASIQAALTF